MDLCKVTLLGVVGADPRTSTTGGGTTALLRLAINRGERDRATGALRKAVDWHTVVTVGRLAEVARKYVRKGDRLYVEGALRMVQGPKGVSTSVLAQNLVLLGRGRKATDGDRGGG